MFYLSVELVSVPIQLFPNTMPVFPFSIEVLFFNAIFLFSAKMFRPSSLHGVFSYRIIHRSADPSLCVCIEKSPNDCVLCDDHE